ncbi:MAG: SRPBCC domain-containing protein [Gemmatimonadota bacterium]|nr:SRPBCC domain-containing protein [Gemmatimonadota bacterium]
MNDSTQSVVIQRLIPAPPRVVFEAWLDREALKRFMCGGPGVKVTRAECDPRVGGEFLVVMNVEGHDLPHRGEYLEIERYKRIVFTWRSHLAGEGSRVTLRFAEGSREQTMLTLEHVGLDDAEIRDKHHVGWSHILTELSGVTAPRQAK